MASRYEAPFVMKALDLEIWALMSSHALLMRVWVLVSCCWAEATSTTPKVAATRGVSRWVERRIFAGAAAAGDPDRNGGRGRWRGKR
jgi:hypothetical protein